MKIKSRLVRITKLSSIAGLLLFAFAAVCYGLSVGVYFNSGTTGTDIYYLVANANREANAYYGEPTSTGPDFDNPTDTGILNGKEWDYNRQGSWSEADGEVLPFDFDYYLRDRPIGGGANDWFYHGH